MTEIAGLDFSTARPSPATLARAGFSFALGYLKPLVNGSPSIMELRPGDVTGYPAAGVQLGAVFESAADRALSGATGGLADAATAQARAAAIGYPTDAVVFAAVDFAVTAAQLPTVHAYLDAFCDNVGHPAGSYGSYTLVEARAARRPGEWLWQTAAWSGGLLSAHAHLYQRAAPSGHWPVIAGTDEDVLIHPLPLLGGDDLSAQFESDVYAWSRTVTAKLDALVSQLTGTAAGTLNADLRADLAAKEKEIDAIAAAVAQEDPAALASALTAALGSDFAQKVIDALGQRINNPPAP